jgi:hypothetical protein
MIDIFEKSLIYLAEHPPGYPLPRQDKSAKQKSALHSRTLSSYIYYPVPAARMFGDFTSSYEAKSASTSEAPSPSHSERAASTLNMSSFAS